MSPGVLTQPCETCGGAHWTRDHADAVAVERRYESADLPGCPWCRECGSCDADLPMNCTCGDCTCAKRCGHPRCLLGLPRQWAHGPDQQRPDSWYEHDPDEGYEFRSDGGRA